MKVFEAKYTLGSLQDKFDSVVTNNGSTTLTGTTKGYAIRLNGSSQWISYDGSRSVKSTVVWLNAKALSKDIIDFDGGTHSIEVGAANVTATGFVSPSIYIDTASTAALPTNKIVCLVVTTATAFNATALKIGKKTSYFNGDILCVKLFDNQLSFNEILQEQAEFTAAQPISKAKRGFIRNRIDDLSQFKGTGINQGLIAAYSFSKRGSTITDITGNNLNGTVTGCINTKDGCKLNGVADKIVLGNIGNVNSVSFRIKPTSTTCKIMEGRANAALIHIASGTLTASDFANIYINGVAGTTMVVNQWQTVTLTSSSSVAFTACTLGLNNTTYGAFEISDLRIYNRVLALNYEIKQYHNSFVLPTFIEDFSTLPCDGSNTVPQGMIQGSGLFKGVEYVMQSGSNPLITTVVGNNTIGYSSSILLNALGKKYTANVTVTNFGGGYIQLGDSQLNANGNYNITWCNTGSGIRAYSGNFTGTLTINSLVEIPPLNFTKNKKFLQCTSAGTISTESMQSSGVWEIDWYKGGDTNSIYFEFVSSNRSDYPNFNGYMILISSAETLIIYKSNTGTGSFFMASTASYIQNNTWYTTRIERTNSGQFTLLIKGVNFVPTSGKNGFTLVSVSGGSGSNPIVDTTYNTSNYAVLSLGVGDAIAGIRMEDGIKQI